MERRAVSPRSYERCRRGVKGPGDSRTSHSGTNERGTSAVTFMADRWERVLWVPTNGGDKPPRTKRGSKAPREERCRRQGFSCLCQEDHRGGETRHIGK